MNRWPIVSLCLWLACASSDETTDAQLAGLILQANGDNLARAALDAWSRDLQLVPYRDARCETKIHLTDPLCLSVFPDHYRAYGACPLLIASGASAASGFYATGFYTPDALTTDGVVSGSIWLWEAETRARGQDVARATLAHEIGHALGYAHSARPSDLMFSEIVVRSPSELERNSYDAVYTSRGGWVAALSLGLRFGSSRTPVFCVVPPYQ